MAADIKLIGYDYTNSLHQYVAVDPETKALLVKDLTAITDHGALTGLSDDDHEQYYNAARHTKAVHDNLTLDHGSLSGKSDDDHTQYWNNIRGDAKIATHTSNASAHHTKTSLLTEISINVHKDWGAMHLQNVGNVECRGATLVAGVQSQGRASGDFQHALAEQYEQHQAFFREEMTNIPSSITLSNAAETTELNLYPGEPTAQRITKYGFMFTVGALVDGRVYSISKKFVTVGN